MTLQVDMPSFQLQLKYIICGREEGNRMKNNSVDKTKDVRETQGAGPSIIINKGGTTYVVGVHFSKSSKETIEEKVKRLLRNEVVMNSN